MGTVGLPMLPCTVKFLYLSMGIQLRFHRLHKFLTNALHLTGFIATLFKCKNQ